MLESADGEAGKKYRYAEDIASLGFALGGDSRSGIPQKNLDKRTVVLVISE
jgi:hypothetical protein